MANGSLEPARHGFNDLASRRGARGFLMASLGDAAANRAMRRVDLFWNQWDNKPALKEINR